MVWYSLQSSLFQTSLDHRLDQTRLDYTIVQSSIQSIAWSSLFQYSLEFSLVYIKLDQTTDQTRLDFTLVTLVYNLVQSNGLVYSLLWSALLGALNLLCFTLTKPRPRPRFNSSLYSSLIQWSGIVYRPVCFQNSLRHRVDQTRLDYAMVQSSIQSIAGSSLLSSIVYSSVQFRLHQTRLQICSALL